MGGDLRELAARGSRTRLLLSYVHCAVVNVDLRAFLRECDLDAGLRIQVASGR